MYNLHILIQFKKETLEEKKPKGSKYIYLWAEWREQIKSETLNIFQNQQF
jgi:hypothetical protein